MRWFEKCLLYFKFFFVKPNFYRVQFHNHGHKLSPFVVHFRDLVSFGKIEDMQTCINAKIWVPSHKMQRQFLAQGISFLCFISFRRQTSNNLYSRKSLFDGLGHASTSTHFLFLWFSSLNTTGFVEFNQKCHSSLRAQRGSFWKVV